MRRSVKSLVTAVLALGVLAALPAMASAQGPEPPLPGPAVSPPEPGELDDPISPAQPDAATRAAERAANEAVRQRRAIKTS